MKLVILGRDGQIGWELQRALVPLGEVVALSRAQADLEYPEALIGAVEADVWEQIGLRGGLYGG